MRGALDATGDIVCLGHEDTTRRRHLALLPAVSLLGRARALQAPPGPARAVGDATGARALLQEGSGSVALSKADPAHVLVVLVVGKAWCIDRWGLIAADAHVGQRRRRRGHDCGMRLALAFSILVVSEVRDMTGARKAGSVDFFSAMRFTTPTRREGRQPLPQHEPRSTSSPAHAGRRCSDGSMLASLRRRRLHALLLLPRR